MVNYCLNIIICAFSEQHDDSKENTIETREIIYFIYLLVIAHTVLDGHPPDELNIIINEMIRLIDIYCVQ